jgi:FMN phosphatase YigB (HAD superfamily)
MQLFIDIDGVLLNFEHSFVRWLNAEYRLGLPEHYEAESWDFTEVLDKRELEAGWHRFLASRAAGEMPALVDPARFNRLVAEHTVHLVTNFPQPHMAKRLSNLDVLGFTYDSLHYCGLHGYLDVQPRTKSQVIATLREVRGEGLFVDDHPDNCVDVHDHCPGVEVWLMSRRFNRGFAHPRIRRAQDWDCLFDRLASRSGGNGAAGNGSAGDGARGAPADPAAGAQGAAPGVPGLSGAPGPRGR